MPLIFIIKKLDKGVIVRQFEETNSNRFIFLNWSNINHIVYEDIKDRNSF